MQFSTLERSKIEVGVKQKFISLNSESIGNEKKFFSVLGCQCRKRCVCIHTNWIWWIFKFHLWRTIWWSL